jgi:ribonuclease BN (tRNA processing enzyme)
MKKQNMPEIDEIIFLGTGGARYVIARQTRATGGILFYINKKSILVDPGPESLLRLLTYIPKFNPEKLDAVILSHKHIDHSADINVYLDILTRGGFKRGGHLIAPQDAFGEDGVIFKYLMQFLEKVDIINPKLKLAIGDIILDFPIRHVHPVETYGLKLKTEEFSVSYVSDTKYTPELIDAYRADILILNLLRLEPSDIEHLSVTDCIEIINGIKPKVALITHFGMTMLRAGPWNVARKLQEKTGITVLAAEDGKHYAIPKLLSYK